MNFVSSQTFHIPRALKSQALTKSLIDGLVGRPGADEASLAEEVAEGAQLVLARRVLGIVEVAENTEGGQFRQGYLVADVAADTRVAGLEALQLLRVVDVQVLVDHGHRLVAILRVRFFFRFDLRGGGD